MSIKGLKTCKYYKLTGWLAGWLAGWLLETDGPTPSYRSFEDLIG
ncbi:MAG: hypothetical protein WBP74_08105 [Nitrososphaeraceae archaeon]